MRRRRKIKILATLGPSSNTAETIEQLFQAGADIFRINMSHTSHEAMRGLVQAIQDLAARFRHAQAAGQPVDEAAQRWIGGLAVLE